MPFSFEDVTQADAEALAELRVLAMQPSLEAVGRFDPERAKERFLANFVATNTQKIMRDGTTIGFFVVIYRPDHLYLDHLYLLPSVQGEGIGQAVVEHIKLLATHQGLPIRLGALRESPANQFYVNLGFTLQYEEEWDLYYQWQP